MSAKLTLMSLLLLLRLLRPDAAVCRKPADFKQVLINLK
jgi:hypothetical protein